MLSEGLMFTYAITFSKGHDKNKNKKLKNDMEYLDFTSAQFKGVSARFMVILKGNR
jgi:hypothetical protein